VQKPRGFLSGTIVDRRRREVRCFVIWLRTEVRIDLLWIPFVFFRRK